MAEDTGGRQRGRNRGRPTESKGGYNPSSSPVPSRASSPCYNPTIPDEEFRRMREEGSAVEVVPCEEDSEADMESSGVEENEDRRVYGKRRRSEASGAREEENEYAVGMTSVAQKDGVFSDPRQVGKFVEKVVGKVDMVRVTRTGMVIIQCKNEEQMGKAVKVKKFGECPVKCFRLEGRGRRRGVISGVPTTMNEEEFCELSGVCEARRLTRFREGEREKTKSVRLTFEGTVLPERIYMDYVCYRVRPFERAPLRCFKCQDYGHVAAVCSRNSRCGRCGKDNCCEEHCNMEEEPKCLHCEGNHRAGAAACPRRVKEVKVNKILGESKGLITYAEAVRRVEGSTSGTETAHAERESKSDNSFTMDKRQFLAFIAMVINCAAEIKTKSERIKMVLDAARRFLGVENVSGEDLDSTLREGFSTQASGTG